MSTLIGQKRTEPRKGMRRVAVLKTRPPVYGVADSPKRKVQKMHITPTVSKLKRECDTLFSRFVRLRDCLETTGTKENGKCFTCDIHTNTVEGFFATFKRGIYGIYHSVSKKHLQKYLQEFSFRYNIRDEQNGVGLASLLSHCDGRLTYRRLVANESC